MEYLSTRSSDFFIDSAQAVLNGLAPDGGLYVPRGLPRLDVAACLKENTMQMASRIIGRDVLWLQEDRRQVCCYQCC